MIHRALFIVLLFIAICFGNCKKEDPVDIPIIETTTVTDMFLCSASTGGNIVSNGGGYILERGVCWSVEIEPTIECNHTSDGKGDGIFVSKLTDLEFLKSYYIRAYARNEAGIAYGNQIQFYTLSLENYFMNYTIIEFYSHGYTLQDLISLGASVTQLYSAGATITDLLNASVSLPELLDANVDVADLLDAGVSVSELIDANVALQDLCRAGVDLAELFSLELTLAELVNGEVGIGYLEQNGVLEQDLIDLGAIGYLSYNDDTYKWVKLGSQIWMAENLRTQKFQNGEDITDQWAYENDENNVLTYGRLYTWNTIKDIRNVCPAGWHIPTIDEWFELASFLVQNGYQYDGKTGAATAKALASTSLWDFSDNTGVPGNDDFLASRNKSGFNAYPGGRRLSNGDYGLLGQEIYLWSSSSYLLTGNRYIHLAYDLSVFMSSHTSSSYAFSVRCLKD